jgi:hypothetical protein
MTCSKEKIDNSIGIVINSFLNLFFIFQFALYISELSISEFIILIYIAIVSSLVHE